MVLSDIARVVRSKNAGPTLLTIDVLFADELDFERGRAALTPQGAAACYGRSADEIDVVAVPAARAIKVVLPRTTPAGAPGDRDAYGAQQHVPLLGLEV